MLQKAKIMSIKTCDSSFGPTLKLSVQFSSGAGGYVYLGLPINQFYKDFKTKEADRLVGREIMVGHSNGELAYVGPYGERIADTITKFYVNLTADVDTGNAVESIKFKMPLEDLVSAIVKGLGGTREQGAAISLEVWNLASKNLEVDRE